MSEKKGFNYEYLKARSDLAIELISQALTSLDLLIAVDNREGKVAEVIFSDRTEFLKNGDKVAVATDFRVLNEIIYDKKDDIPEHISKKYKDNIIDLEALRTSSRSK